MPRRFQQDAVIILMAIDLECGVQTVLEVKAADGDQPADLPLESLARTAGPG